MQSDDSTSIETDLLQSAQLRVDDQGFLYCVVVSIHSSLQAVVRSAAALLSIEALKGLAFSSTPSPAPRCCASSCRTNGQAAVCKRSVLILTGMLVEFGVQLQLPIHCCYELPEEKVMQQHA